MKFNLFICDENGAYINIIGLLYSDDLFINMRGTYELKSGTAVSKQVSSDCSHAMK